jgi:hypothetical protein
MEYMGDSKDLLSLTSVSSCSLGHMHDDGLYSWHIFNLMNMLWTFFLTSALDFPFSLIFIST